jgi:hypothetical protein
MSLQQQSGLHISLLCLIVSELSAARATAASATGTLQAYEARDGLSRREEERLAGLLRDAQNAADTARRFAALPPPASLQGSAAIARARCRDGDRARSGP